MTIIKCTNCKKEIPEDSSFCMHCGNKVIKLLSCHTCNFKGLPLDAKFCPICGSLISDNGVGNIITSLKSNEQSTEKPQVGDFFYQDGTLGKTRDYRKICMGVVCSLQTTEAERKEGWMNGHIIALNDMPGLFSWKNQNSKGLVKHDWDFVKNERNGCLLTKQMGYDCITSCHKLKELSEFCSVFISDWYVPSIGQWYELLQNFGGRLDENRKVIVNSRFNKIAKDILKLEKSYWSSSPANNPYLSWSLTGGCNMIALIRNSSMLSIRPIAAF